jgi:transposase
MKKNNIAKKSVKRPNHAKSVKRTDGAGTASELRLTIGLDLGDRRSRYCVLDQNGEMIQEEAVATSREGLKSIPGAAAGSRIVIEVGSHSPWVSRWLKELGFEVIVANARKVAMISQSTRKNDRLDAQMLARLGRIDAKLLAPIQHRSAQAQGDLAVIRMRAQLVDQRTELINCARGTVKAMGGRLPSCEGKDMGVEKLAGWKLGQVLEQLLKPLFTVLDHLNEQIAVYEKEIAVMKERYPQIKLLTPVYGVGELIAMTYVLTLEDPAKFRRSRDVGPYLGLTSKQRDSGQIQPQMHITKEGDRYLRKLLVQAAQCMLKPGAQESDLRRWALGHFRPGDKKGKKKAVVGLARRIAVLLHMLWVNGEGYEPNYQQHQQQKAVRAAA